MRIIIYALALLCLACPVMARDYGASLSYCDGLRSEYDVGECLAATYKVLKDEVAEKRKSFASTVSSEKGDSAAEKFLSAVKTADAYEKSACNYFPEQFRGHNVHILMHRCRIKLLTAHLDAMNSGTAGYYSRYASYLACSEKSCVDDSLKSGVQSFSSILAPIRQEIKAGTGDFDMLSGAAPHDDALKAYDRMIGDFVAANDANCTFVSMLAKDGKDKDFVKKSCTLNGLKDLATGYTKFLWTK